ncbi:MAG TPA: EAL domain-containing protein [Gemmatimonadales bacterium]|nr:EAL domain-containing protein [Gemmatimonadales bacterium]
MTEAPRPDQVFQPLTERLLLRSRFGRRLLFLFMICALVPTCAVAFLSFRSVSDQLTEQSRERLAALASASGKTLYDRLTFLENDLRKVIPRLTQCRGNGVDGASRDCGEGLLYALEGLARLSGDKITVLVGDTERMGEIRQEELPVLAPGQSVVIADSRSDVEYGLYLVYRPNEPSAGTTRFLARIDPSYLWSPADDEALPGNVDLSLWDPGLGMLIGSASLSSLPPDLRKKIASTSRGTIEWPGKAGASVATWWSLPETRRFRFPAWRVLLSEPQADVQAPMVAFSRSFPLLLAVALLMVLILGISQIRRSLAPLAELRRGTRRIADRDFETPVQVSSGDELQELAGAFNAMTLQLGRQFRALKTAAEIDRAVLSSVDTAAIVQTVLDRVPEIAPCETISVTLLEAGSSSVGTTWTGLCAAGRQKKMATVMTPDDIRETRRYPERLLYGKDDLAIPEYLAHFRRANEAVVVEAYPLGYGGELLGVLAVRRKAGESSEEDTVQVRRLADQVAVALSNARMVDQVRFLAFYDSLTRLPNRVLYKERLAQALVRAERTHKLVAVCFLDLDHFSRINDTLGHDLGDVLLKEVAARLVACSRPTDSVARVGMEESVAEVSRLGGDEFTVILPDITDPQDAVRVARRLLEAFRQPLRLGTQEVFVTTSMGVAIYPFDGADTEELLKSADVAMYHAKEQGRNTYQLYSSSMNTEAMARMQLESQLRKAVESGEFTIWYQPIIDLASGKPTGAEALVRWAHPERGLVSPGEFISLCEECGLIVPLGEWILRTVCTQAKAWEDVGLGPMRMCVNLSARQLRHDGIVETVRTILRETGLQPGTLELELTESMLMEPAGVVGRTIRELADLGVSLAIDDFGTGYSSLSYLKNFPVKTLKIDRTFIMNVTTDTGNAAITTAIIALAGAMGLEVVAEGVETQLQADFLRERGCHRGQGYLFGKPVPVTAFENFLRGDEIVEARAGAVSAGVPV